eukprot:CAMPEP_0194190094 /NCGR_PEP_ID=MMETSP0154-20130528/61742_1 /TAXON_ID=1049557 /ORGANISM="Thalassiothrix antarctica, Strain L6-D1" /LENGTH=397 /DNA_ID=CAMNT_0038911801 /DNA_START=21 /DNA_END=1214 /DNA_ORIENTATION=-
MSKRKYYSGLIYHLITFCLGIIFALNVFSINNTVPNNIDQQSAIEIQLQRQKQEQQQQINTISNTANDNNEQNTNNIIPREITDKPLLTKYKNPLLKRQSLHPKWKLWEEMNETEREKAIDEVIVYLDKYGQPLMSRVEKLKKERASVSMYQKVDGCQMVGDRSSFTAHHLCDYLPPPDEDCAIVSFGINTEFNFEIDIVETWKNCIVFAADPTVTHTSKPHPKVTFHNFAAEMVEDNAERKRNKGGAEPWWYVSFPQIMKLLRLEKIHVLKIDCEGCEHALARDIIAEDPNFLHKVDQLSLETHLTRSWITNDETFYYFGLLFPLLEEAGLQMQTAEIFGGGRDAELLGCYEKQFNRTIYPCGSRFSSARKKVPIGWSCQDFLWARDTNPYPSKKD